MGRPVHEELLGLLILLIGLEIVKSVQGIRWVVVRLVIEPVSEHSYGVAALRKWIAYPFSFLVRVQRKQDIFNRLILLVFFQGFD